MLDLGTALRIGRPDQARTAIFAASSDSSQRETGTTAAPSATVAATAKVADWKAGITGNVDTGRMSAGVLAIMVVSLVGFYWWTRGHQA